MYGSRLWIFILTLIAFATTSYMAIKGDHPSWSQHAGTSLEWLFIYAISSIAFLYVIRSFTHFERERSLFKLGTMDVRMQVLNRISALMFMSIMAFAVWNHEAPHFIFTGLAIASVHLELWTYHKSGMKAWAFRMASLVTIFGFIGGFFFHWYSIGIGESIVAFPAVVYVLLTNKKEA